MSRIGIANLTWGFFMIFTAACGGVFVALRASEVFISGYVPPTWESVLHASSHGHTSLFGMIHILFGLTIPYAAAGYRENLMKTIGLLAGSFAMGPLMLVRASLGPTLSTELNGILIGAALSCALLAIFYHVIGLARKLAVRG